jgi:putative ABC transport system permease protein
MNLTNAQSSRRLVEVGIRKVVGAGRGQLIGQFLAEALVLSLMAAVLAFGIAELSFLLLGDLLEVSISVFDKQNTDVYLILLGVTIITGFLAGGYPALVLSGISSLSSFKRYYKIGGNNLFTRSVLSVQFGLSIILIVCAITMWKQQRFMMNKDLGYNKEQVLVLPISNRDTASIDVLKNEIKKYNETLNVTKTSGSFTRGNNVTFQKMSDNSTLFIYMLGVDEDYLNTMQIELAAGEAFNENNMMNPFSIMVNEAFVKKFDFGDSIGIKLGRKIGFIDEPVVVGVIKDFHHASLHSEIAPMMLMHSKTLNNSYLNIRLAPGKIAGGVEKIEQLWKKTNADSPFEYFFLDDDIDKQYAVERRWSNIITVATCMAIFLSVLGLIGLAMFTAEQRKKEIGVRKVLGASLKQLVAMLSKDYLWLIAGAFFIAGPISYYIIVNYWLQNFDYHIEVDVMIYLAAFVIVILIAALAIGSQMVRAAIQNPVDTLKEE